ncbi:hypothetical protein COT20_02765 [bacterium (Candidatus Gribaldobacteria) CG08_land_8_20_14_0_20_39_15]|uniref:ATP-cone domain-containing protein n=1 Tax=bacterium (Candidatus Gribaldobacteria) CG08_land_8_20_14_0_20_39_15 TaxID=2014273 RepID=A0A2M6XTW4_9BACT|nr:MAG: hypothetical protein COT20_02765 [bacterium (Candidatus Gribaldobacteria) CG08_land_8_20_14_0_20_39_15]
MANFVIKKDGTKEPFDAGKIRRAIAGAAQRTELPEERKNEVVERVLNAALLFAAGKEEMATTEIRGKILGELSDIEPSVAEEWKRREQEK